MTYEEYYKLCFQLEVLKEVSKQYSGTIGNTIQQIESRIRKFEENVREND